MSDNTATANSIVFGAAINQITFSEAESQTKKRKIRCEIFLEWMDKEIPWKQLQKKFSRYTSSVRTDGQNMQGERLIIICGRPK
mgnify:CR=1 FL=1